MENRHRYASGPAQSADPLHLFINVSRLTLCYNTKYFFSNALSEATIFNGLEKISQMFNLEKTPKVMWGSVQVFIF